MRPFSPCENRVLDQLESLIAEGEEILSSGQWVPVNESLQKGCAAWIADTRVNQHPGEVFEFDWPRFVEWRTNCVTVLNHVVGQSPVHARKLDEFHALSMSKPVMECAVATLRALRNDWRSGFLHSLRGEVEAAVGTDMLDSARDLLEGGQHGIAGAIAGIVFEQAFRSFCLRQSPTVPDHEPDGKPINLSKLIDTARTARVLSVPLAAECRSWVAIRNHCAHGEFDAVSSSQVERMLDGVRDFLIRSVQ